MPVPAAATMSKKAQGLYGQKLGPDAIAYVDKLMAAVETAWKSWQNSMTWGGLAVSGGGVGAWSGMSPGGGMLQASSPFQMEVFIFKSGTPQQTKFTKGLADALASKFNAFPAGFKFSTIQFIGTSGATPVSPGPVQANSVAAPLSSAGKGQNPSGIADVWKASLTPPDFDFSNPNGKSEDLLKAIAKSIEQSFQTVWLMTTMAQGNMITTAGAAGGVVAGFMSPNNGKLV
jgi:hypothetical protein